MFNLSAENHPSK